MRDSRWQYDPGVSRGGSSLARRLVPVVAIGAAVALGLGLQAVPRFPAAAWLLAAPVLLFIVFIALQGPRWCVAALLTLVIVGWSSSGIAISSLDLRMYDIPYAALLAWVFVIRSRDGRREVNQIGQLPLALFLLALGASMIPIVVHGTGTDSVVAWLRFVQTFSLVWLIPYALRNIDDVEFLLGFVGLALTFEVGRAELSALFAGTLGDPRLRLAGAYSTDTMGLLAALLIIAALHSPVPRHRSLRVTMLVVGVPALLATRSLGSIAALAVALAIFGLRAPAPDRARDRTGLLMPARVLLLAVVALVGIGMVKGGNLPQSNDFAGSTTVHRAVLGTAGLELFAENPFVGVGFGHAPIAVVSSNALNDSLRRRFGKDVNPVFFPESGPPVQVHNAYIEVLAEAGLLGFGLLIATAFASGRGIAGLLRKSRGDPRVYAASRAVLVLLVAILVWWNDNGIYGGQPESVLAAAFLGVLAAMPVPVRITPTTRARAALTR